jgi:hypothetical protein
MPAPDYIPPITPELQKAYDDYAKALERGAELRRVNARRMNDLARAIAHPKGR